MTYTCLQAIPAPTTVSHAYTCSSLTYSCTRMPHCSRFRQPHPSKRNKKLGQTYGPQSRRCCATKHGLTPGSTALQAAHARRRRCRCRRRNPARVAPAKKAETMRYDTTRHHSCIQAGSPTHSVPVHSAVMPTSASLRMNHHLTSGVLASKTNLTALFASKPYMSGGIITLSPP